MKLLDKLRFNPTFPEASRRALSGVASSLLFSITTLLQRHLREERNGKPIEADLADPAAGESQTDHQSEQTGAADGQTESASTRVEQGHTEPESVLITAGRMKSLYEWVATELAANARLLLQPDGKKLPDPMHCAQTVESVMLRRTNPRVRSFTEAELKEIRANAAAVGYSEDEAIQKAMESENRLAHVSALAAARDAERICELFHELRSIGEDGHELEVEASFERLGAARQAQIVVAIDRTLLNAFEAFRADAVKPRSRNSRPNAAADAWHINQMRWDVRKCFTEMRMNPRFQRELDESEVVLNWATEPLKREAVTPAKRAA